MSTSKIVVNSIRWLLACAVAQALLIAPAVAATPVAVAQPYSLENTEVVATPGSRSKRAYEIYVSLPADYASSTQRYPVVYVTDAPYAFPLIRAIAGRVDRHGVGLEPFILVGLSYAIGESAVVSRNRDYTRTARAGDRSASETAYGQSAEYLSFIQDDVLPLVDRRYRTDTQRRVFVGHSYGSLLGLLALLNERKVFSHYILGSPSLWFDNGQAFTALKRYSETHSDLVGKVRIYTGGLEQPTRNRRTRKDMVGLMNRYMADLRAHRWRGLDVKAAVLDGEDHATVFPRLVTQGLMWALPRER